MAVPSKPTNVTVFNITETAASFSWTKVVSSPALQDYIISILNVDTNKIFLGSTTIGFAQTGTAIFSLTPNTKYRFSIIARNSDGFSPETIVDWITLGVIPPPPPTGEITQSITNGKIVSNVFSATITLTNVALHPTDTKLFFRVVENDFPIEGELSHLNQKAFTPKEGINNVSLDITKANNGGNLRTINFPDFIFVSILASPNERFVIPDESIKVLVEPIAIPPPAVTGLAVSNVLETSLTVSWNKVVEADDYLISVLNVDTNKIFISSQILSVNQISTGIGGLTPSTNYRFSIIARNSSGNSSESLIDFLTTGIPLEPEPIPDESMSIITAQNFKIENNRVLGSVAIVATSSFDPFFNDLPLTLFTQIKNLAGEPLVLKENSIFFNNDVREQNINIDESAFDETKVTVELFVQDSTGRIFSSPVLFDLEAVLLPPVDDLNTFTQDFTLVEYKGTELGKSLFVQIQVTKNIEPQNNIVESILQVLRQDRSVANLEFQEIDVKGANAFAIVYDIPDLNLPTANIFVQHFIQTLEGIPLSDVIEIPAFFDQPPAITPEKGDNFFNKLIGVFAGVTALSVYLSTRKKR